MDDKQLYLKARALQEAAEGISHPMLPQRLKAYVVNAAEIVAELANREVRRARQGPTTADKMITELHKRVSGLEEREREWLELKAGKRG